LVAITDWIDADDWSFTGIESLAIDPGNPDRVYIACGTYTNDWSPTNGASFRSHDRGRTWRRTDMPFKMGGNEDGRSNGERLAVDPTNSSIVFFGSRNAGLWRSVDAGATWSRVMSFPDVATSRSTMSGSNQWSRPVGIAVVLFGPAKSIYAGVSTPEESFYRSDDGGATWSAVSRSIRTAIVRDIVAPVVHR
jgi:photosystem II stability/assembly factor-like uncharacterized protein